MVLLLAAATLIAVSAPPGGGALRSVRSAFSSVLTPVQGAVHGALAPIGNFFTGAVDYGALRADNARLREELAALSNRQAQAAYAEQQANQVLSEAHLPFLGGIRTVTAQVVNNNAGSNFETTITIDRGSRQGIVAGQPVVGAAGLVGSVTSVTAVSATVTLVQDPTFDVGVTLPGGLIGSVAGQGLGNPLHLTVLPSSQAKPPRIKVGEVLSTSGLSTENFPAGIPVGRVASVTTPAGQTEPVATLAPAALGLDLQYVDVLLWSSQ